MRRLLTVLALVALATTLLVVLPGEAEAYSFEVEKEYVEVQIKKDGSIDIHYWITFVNYETMDGVDIGLPNRHYDEDSAWAKVRVGNVVYQPDRIRRSPYVEIGLAVEFDYQTQTATTSTGGKRFTLEFFVNNPHMVYLNELEEGTVGIRFRPTWFSDEFQRGFTENLTTVVFLPKGFDGERAYWLEGRPWDEFGYDVDKGRYFVRWTDLQVSPNAIASGQMDVGVAFDEKWVDRYYEHGFW
ncbi:MAG: hypothetical protein GWN18_13470, partial [Thermoplasmata archaeon]|nr:hypothetical protein [Thermoplasmata archaeon]NIS13070.1 hypothetical protein [Thermoplasmata archaeon]NIS20973.1 hypothetical protein [Thermoplasmata archaeon]NIT78427.1 hypothetical protein [Thermoplasmata archaeon]NIU50026.1 hypothetical protein [Thermoplasmata archaeon]